MKIIDLSHPISENIPTYFDDKKPFLQVIGDVAEYGHREMDIAYNSHIGTHIDLPAHMIMNGKTIDKTKIEKYFGKGIKINVANVYPNKILRKYLSKFQAEIRKVDFVLLHSGYGKYWGRKKYFSGFPTLETDAAEWLCDFKIKGIGIDMISIDSTDSVDYINHKIFFKNEILIIENLTNLDKIPDKIFYFSCLPLNIKNADGSPIRAVAVIV
ncbi:MAG: cyclase family protein [Ignavibacteriales bacterium]|nr:cyclase family protein [Ignavibacteriales bacterium]